MFCCDVCGSVVPPRTAPINLVVEIRARTYPRRSDAHWQPPRDGGKGKWVDDPGGTGTEIARELRVCAACAPERPG